MSSANRVYAGLSRLLGKTPTSMSVQADPAEDPVVDPADDADPADPDHTDPAADPADPADPAADPADPADPDPAPADPAADTSSSDYAAGVAAANQRWAAVLISPAAQANLELATDLMAENPSMSPSAIIGMCERHGVKPGAEAPAGGKSAAQQLLDRTPKPALGVAEKPGANASDPAKSVRKQAAASANAKLQGRGTKAQAELKKAGGN